ncbi:MAG: hypothetical protein LBU65_03845 [Planctomycetaceae bacterium]|jgi:hypothetical protein|nr:hypothetical protein [Planctomycetaceae bacterium]
MMISPISGAFATVQSYAASHVGGFARVGIAAPVDSVSGVRKDEKVSPVSDAARVDKDADKVHSLSGDILDISSAGQVAVSGNSAIKESDESRLADESTAKSTARELTPEEQEQVHKLKARDIEVRAHEAAHIAAAGPYATGGPTFTYQTGPDGKRYAVGGEVSVDSSPISGDPQATISKMQTIRAAALAPADPSSQDQKVASEASQQEAKARMQLTEHQQEELKTKESESSEGSEAVTYQRPTSAASDKGAVTNKTTSEGSNYAQAYASEPAAAHPLSDSKSVQGGLRSNAIAHYQAQSNLSSNTTEITRRFAAYG